MRLEDLQNVSVGDILKCKDIDAKFKVTEIDLSSEFAPLQVELIEGPSDLTTGTREIDRFDRVWGYNQWVYVDIEVLRKAQGVKGVYSGRLITLARLELDDDEPQEIQEPQELEKLTAFKAAEITKRRLIGEVLDRIKNAILNGIGVWQIKVQDLDLNPVWVELEALGYAVSYDVQSNEFEISWLLEL